VDRPGISAVGVQERVHEAVHAILSDDHNYELGVRAAREVAESALAAGGAAELVEMIVATSLKLAETLERIAAEQGLAAVDLAEVWLVA
jgi:hypothetical protein